MSEQPQFLPMSLPEAKELCIDQFDVILISGDAYVDHPSFAAALIGRVLWDAGYSVGIIAQPDWKKDDDLRQAGQAAPILRHNLGKRGLHGQQFDAQFEAAKL